MATTVKGTTTEQQIRATKRYLCPKNNGDEIPSISVFEKGQFSLTMFYRHKTQEGCVPEDRSFHV